MKALRRKLTMLRVASCAAALLCAGAFSAAHAQVNVVAATGGGAISADNVAGAWTDLTGPELDETSNNGSGAFGTGTIVLNAPAGFEFNPAATVTVSIGLASGSGSGGNQIDLYGGRGNPVSAAVTATTITVSVRRTSRSSTHNSLTWSGIQVRPTAHCPPASGTISASGTSSFTPATPDLGDLAEVAGARRMYTVLPAQSFGACSGVSGTPASQVAGVAFNLVSLVVADQWGNVDTGYSGSKTISYSGPTGTNSYTTSVAFSAGVSTTTLATTINTTQTTTISATDGAVAGVASSSFTVSAPLLHYAMDEGAWTGAAGEVVDDSGNGYNGTATNGAATSAVSPAIAGSPGTCGYGAFARTSRNYVAVPASFPNLAGSFTVAAWIRTTDNGQSGQRVMIDDQSNTQGWGLSLGDGGVGRLRFYSRGTPSALILDTPSVIANNTWYFVAAVADTGAKTKHIYVFDQAGALLSQVSASWTEASFGSDAGPASIGGETNASGENSTSFYFSGNIDEVRVYQSALDAAQLLAVEQLTQPCASFTHYAINLPGGSTGLTCEPSQVKIAAHDAAHVEVAPAAGTVLTLSTSTGGGAWVAGLVSGTGTWTPSGLNDGLATYVWPGGETNFTVRLRQNTPATLSVNLIDTGGRTEASTEDPSITFADTAFRVTDAGGAAVATLGTQLAGKPSNTGFGAQTRYLQAMRTDTSTGACTTVFQNQTVSVGLAGARLNPSGGASTLSVQNSGAAMQAIATGAGAPGAYSNVSLAFDAQSKAPLVVSYPDAGSVQLYASYALPSPPAGSAITGSSNAFVVRPFGLRVSGVTSTASPSPSSPVFAKAGQSFPVTLTAVAWKAGDDANADGVPDSDAQIAANAATPNFDAAATLSHSLNAPAGGNAGTLGGSTSFSGFSAGAKTQSVNWSEVGFIDLHATSSNYLGSGQNVSNSSAGLTGVGRFIPDHLTLSGGVLTNRAAAACAPASAFSYLGEGMRLQYSLTANNASGAATQNYTTASGYAKLPKAPANASPASSMGFGAANGATNLGSRLDLGNVANLTWTAGAASVDYTLAVRRASPDNPDGPFGAVRIGVAPTDEDGVGLASAAYDMDVDNNAVNDHQQVGASTQLRFGRLAMDNALGPDGVAVPVPITLEYWNGATFATNSLDSCTQIPRSAIVLDAYEGALAPGGGNCKTYVQQGAIAFGAGAGTLTLAAPAAGVTGSVRLTPNLGTVATGNYCASAAGGETPASAAVLPYLLGRWNDSLNPDGIGSTMYDDNPSARAAFGLYGSQPDNLIFQRERY
jgi:MSHA biogenesis protein MshQ